MTPDRIDQLLDQALRSGAIPSDATAEERAEIEGLLARAGDLRLNAAKVEAEAREAMPAARARFQRHLAAQRPAMPVAAAKGPGLLSRLFSGRGMAFVSSAATIAVIAVLAIVVLQPFSETETASALTVDDYVQVHGVVSSAEDGMVTVNTPELGNLEVVLSDLTAVTDQQGTRERATLQPGETVLISGIVTSKRAIAASNVAVAGEQSVPQAPDAAKIPLLKDLREGLQGSISLFTLSPDGTRARVLIVTPNARFLVDVDPQSMDQFLAENPGAVGARVRVVDAPDLAKGVFRLQPLNAPTGTPPAGGPPPAEFENVRGVVTARNLNVLTVQTQRGPIMVVLRASTQIRVGASTITLRDVQDGDRVIGQEVAVSGNLEGPASKRILASLLIVLGPAPQRGQ